MKNSQKENSHTGEVGSPAMELVVNINREEVIQTGSKTYKYDDSHPNPEVTSTNGRCESDEVCLKTRRKNLRIGTWNVRTLYKAGKLENLVQEAEIMKLDILGIAETRWTDADFIELENHIFIHSGGDRHERGVAFLIKKELQKSIVGYWTVNERCILLKIKAKPFDIAIIQIYAPTKDWSDEEVEVFYENIQKTIKQLKSTDVLIVMGDFNAKVGNESYKDIVGKYGLGTKNDRGVRLVEFCEENKLVISNTMFEQPKRRLYTWKSPGDWKRNQIDFFLIHKRFKNSVVNIRTYPGADINSDHSPVIANVHIKLKKITKQSNKVTKYDMEALKIKGMQEKYLVEVRNKYEVLSESQNQVDATESSNIEKKWENLKTSIHHGCSTTLPKKERTAKQPWMTEEILDLMKVRKQSKNSQKKQVLDKEIDKRCRKAKEEWLNSKCDTIERLQMEHKTREMHQEVKSLTEGEKKRSNRSGSIKSKDGQMLFDNEDISHRWTEYIKDLFKDERTEERPVPENDEGPCILKEEVTDAMRSLKNGKSCGPDEIYVEMLRALGDFGVDRITELCNDIYNTGYLPEEMRKSIFIILPKKAHAVECSDHRTISLMSHVTKLLLRIILKRIKNRIEGELSEEQCGFRDQRGTREAIFNMKMIMEKHIEVQADVYTCFIDYSKAFDRVHHDRLIECLQMVNLDGKDIRIITNLYWDQLAALRIDNQITEYIKIERGVRQGCVLSPCLFNICTEMIFREIEDRPGVCMGGRNITNIRFADDTTLLAKDEKTLNDTLLTIKAESLKYGLSMNSSKTKTMVISKKVEKPTINISIDGNKIEQVGQFTYLGQILDENADHEKEIKRRIGISKSAFNNMKSIFQSRKINMKLKLRLLKCYIWSVLLHGVETWTISKKMEKRLEAYEMWLYRRIGRVSWTEKKTNKEVLCMLGMKRHLLSNVKKRKLNYFGHIKRHQTIQKDTLEGKVEGKRGRGRPRLKWEDNIKGWTQLNMAECNKMTKEREDWKYIVANLPKEEGT